MDYDHVPTVTLPPAPAPTLRPLLTPFTSSDQVIPSFFMRLSFSSCLFSCSHRVFSHCSSFCTRLSASLSKYLLFSASNSLNDQAHIPPLRCWGLVLLLPVLQPTPSSSFALSAAPRPIDPSTPGSILCQISDSILALGTHSPKNLCTHPITSTARHLRIIYSADSLDHTSDRPTFFRSAPTPSYPHNFALCALELFHTLNNTSPDVHSLLPCS